MLAPTRRARLALVIPGLLAATVAAATTQHARADDPAPADALAARVAPFLEPRTFVVGHVDVKRIDVPAVVDLALNVGLDIPDAGRDQLKALREGFLAAGGSDVFVLFGWDDLAEGTPVVVVPTTRAAALGAVVTGLIPKRDGVVVESFRGAVVIGAAEAVARLRSRKQPANRPDVVEALRATGKVGARLVVASHAEERRVVRAMLGDLPEPAGRRFGDLFTRAEWFALASDVPPAGAIRFESKMPDATAAKAMLQLQRDLLAAAGKVATTEKSPDFARVVGTIDATVAEDRVRLQVTGDKNVREMLAAIRPQAFRTRERLRVGRRTNDLKQLALAFHNYADAYRFGPKRNTVAFPARAIVDPDGRPLLSWRVRILPFIEQKELYEKFKLNEPWDSKHNKPLLAEMPKLYAARSGRAGMTTYLLPVMPDSLFGTGDRVSFSDITDGTSNTMLIVDAADELAVPWTKPADWEVDPKQPSKGLAQPGSEVFVAAFADGSVRTFRLDIEPETLRAYVTKSGGEVTP